MTALNPPMSPIVCQNLFRRRLSRCFTRNAIDRLAADVPCFLTYRFSLNLKSLANIRKLEIIIERGRRPYFSSFNATMLAVTGAGKFSSVSDVLKIRGNICIQHRLIQLNGKVIVCATCYQILRKAALRQ